ncbi:N-terminal ig-like domain of cellulase [Salegentibacter echinorum]|uniref:N-terminal ig-like domain of cellulase n=1 Tax=Salegentibacter echinorum TaxID=1073325 RepID=A0A1M5E0P5_SALEC|nr:glycoside hydrolase family 9 protein [Salegentibacter echinorum]SHF72799.1 N-terminal ig-like domain of cellulase [Salegentibacter echinorum]
MKSFISKCLILFLGLTINLMGATTPQDEIFIRLNQVGFLEEDAKTAVIFSNTKVTPRFHIENTQNGEEVYSGKLKKVKNKGWGNFKYYYKADFSKLKQPGKFKLSLSGSGIKSTEFGIGRTHSYTNYHEDLLGFMRQQRCGYNSFLDMVCHQRDGRSMFGPMPDSTFVDVSGGWHDAGDQLKYLITGSNATAKMLKAYELIPEKFSDKVNALGQEGKNGIPDVLDEAKWGLDWIHKLHTGPGELFHQVADDRDHLGMKWPDKDSSDYGWGPNSYRVAYFATGKPQGLSEYKSKATGIANLAGRSAAAMAIGARIWEEIDPKYAQKCREAAFELYRMGKKQEGFQQGNSYGAPYRYNEDTWADDMEWAAAELFINTREEQYLEDAMHYAEMAASVSWMDKEDAEHYRFYPFFNIGHFVLYDLVDKGFQEKLAGYYQEGIEATTQRGANNPYQIGVPFIWCSNNLTANLITQIILYEEMTGDKQYHDFMLAQRDWLLGNNPWGTSMFMNIPENGEYPEDVHTSIWFLTGKEVPGGLVDGPVYRSVYENLRGLTLKNEDEFAKFQNDFVVYHDDFGDYSTNEPTMDGTADAIFLMAWFAQDAAKE